MRTRYSVLSCMLLGLGVNSAQAVSLLDYQEATSAYEDAYVNGSFDYSTNKNVTLANGNKAKDTYNLLANIDYERVLSSPIRDFKFDAFASGSYSRNTDGTKTRNYEGNASAEVRNYFRPNSRGAFWYGSTAVEDVKGKPSYYADVALGIGYGRVVNLTPMAKAIRVVDKLRAQGKLNGDLSVPEYQKIANIIARKPEYNARFGAENYRMNWVSDMVSVINGSGRTNGSLDAAGVLKVYDVLENGSFITRKSGWLVKGGVDKVVKNYGDGSTDTGLQLGAEYHRPVSNNTQFSNVTAFTSNLKSSREAYRARNDMMLATEFSDRVAWENGWNVSRTKVDGTNSSGSTGTNHKVYSTYKYHLSNRLDFNAGLEFTKNSGQKTDGKFLSGVSYRLK